MARPSDGIARKDRSRTALFAFITARLHDVAAGDGERELFAAIGVNVSPSAAGKAATAVRSPPGEDAHGEASDAGQSAADDSGPDVSAPPALRKWLILDEPRLDLDVALLRFDGKGERHRALVSALTSIAGIRQVIEVAGSFEVIAIAVFDGAQARLHLKSLVQERTGLDPAWFDVESESWAGSLPTWRALTRRAAQSDGLAKTPMGSRPGAAVR